MKNCKIHAIALILVIIAEAIGTIKFKIGPGIVVLLPMLYALFFGIMLSPKFLKVVNDKDMLSAKGMITISLMLLMAKYGTTIGPTLPKIIKSSPALFFQEFGHLGSVICVVPIAVLIGLKRETIGAGHSIGREPNVALISDLYGLDGPEGQGVMGVYICGTVLGTIFYGILASLFAAYLPFHPYALAMASGVGSASMMTAAVGSLSAMFPSMKDTIVAYGAAGNMFSGLCGVYISLWIAIPFTEWAYKKLYFIKYRKPASEDEQMIKKEV
ncbi:DUF3100 domain-containing protein [Clostridium drakei]|uniref:DUF3100 domain-containing protein n=1 Tax=Clostridium drakei TaxID=332101 RepID=A0A2U8DNX0_9CLOT|nr:DUF3100 domain-containing protein [Clostridium drakei]AWI04359.1 hypothetical protein B9W14_07555 [Clostridium drakei]